VLGTSLLRSTDDTCSALETFSDSGLYKFTFYILHFFTTVAFTNFTYLKVKFAKCTSLLTSRDLGLKNFVLFTSLMLSLKETLK